MSDASAPESPVGVREALKQLSLNLPPHEPRYERDRFAVSKANEAAWKAATAWLESDEPALMICGPDGAGKTHLAHVLAARQDGAAFLSAADFSGTQPPAPFSVVDDLPAGDPKDLLAAFETASAEGARMVFAGAGHPSAWAQGVKDLRTRLEAAPRAVLGEPDEALIRAVISKGFSDRQLLVAPSVVEYAAQRLPRTFAAAHAFVALSDRLALEERRKITAPLVQNLLDNLSEGRLKA